MINKDSFSVKAQVEIADSLEDMRDAFEADFEALPDESKEMAANLAYVYGNVLHRFNDGEELGISDLRVMRAALGRSIENCTELDLDDAAADYNDALTEVIEFS